MIFFAAFVLIAAVTSAEPTKAPSAVSIIAQIFEAIAALKPQPIAVGPAIVDVEPIAVGPVIVEKSLEGIAVGPTLIDFPLPDGGAVSAPVVDTSPVAIIEGPAADVSASALLVQIILNINLAAQSIPVAVGTVVAPEPVQDVEDAPAAPVRPVPIATLPVPVEEVAPPAPVRPVKNGKTCHKYH